jgi:hypothetical protein
VFQVDLSKKDSKPKPKTKTKLSVYQANKPTRLRKYKICQLSLLYLRSTPNATLYSVLDQNRIIFAINVARENE